MIINKKQKSKYDCIKTRFAFLPTRIDNTYIWFEKYYIIRLISWYSPFDFVLRFLTKEEAMYAVDEIEHNKQHD